MDKTCPRCHYSGDISNIKRHYNRKIPCKVKYEDVSIKECLKKLEKGDYKCKHCKGSFKYRSFLDKHESVCKSIINKIDGNNNTININSNNKINIIINSYSESNYEFLRQKINECIDIKGVLDIPKLLEIAHFNEEHPENHNIYMNSSNAKEIMVYDGEKFNKKCKGNQGIEKFLNVFGNKVNKKTDDTRCKESVEKYKKSKDFQGKKMLRDKVSKVLKNKKTVLESHNTFDDDDEFDL